MAASYLETAHHKKKDGEAKYGKNIDTCPPR